VTFAACPDACVLVVNKAGIDQLQVIIDVNFGKKTTFEASEPKTSRPQMFHLQRQYNVNMPYTNIPMCIKG
jgi:hypothetical protein